MLKLPKPISDLGYDDKQIDEIMGERRAGFEKWMFGQTMGYEDGKLYYYPQDVERFLLGLRVVD